MQTAIKFQSEIKTVPFMGKSITIENLTLVLSPKERERRKKKLKNCFMMFLLSIQIKKVMDIAHNKIQHHHIIKL